MIGEMGCDSVAPGLLQRQGRPTGGSITEGTGARGTGAQRAAATRRSDWNWRSFRLGIQGLWLDAGWLETVVVNRRTSWLTSWLVDSIVE